MIDNLRATLANGLLFSMRAFFDRLNWYASRLAAMDAREVVHRIGEALKKMEGRRYGCGWDSFFPAQIEWTSELIRHRIRLLDDQLITREVAAIKAGRFKLLGIEWPSPRRMPPEPDFWHLEPESGQILSRTKYCFDISFRHGLKAPEIKRVWELNRLQFLVALAANARLNGDAEARALVFGLVDAWMEANPPFRGINWLSGIELALRLTSVGIAFSIIGLDHLDQYARDRLGRFVSAHVFWIARYPSLFSSANNHRVAELTGSLVGAALAPRMPEAAGLRQRITRELLAEMTHQILPDGVGAEQSPAYTAFAIELFLTARLFLPEQQNPLPGAVSSRLSAWADHMRWMMDASGRVPDIGDSDNCRVIATSQRAEPCYVGSIVAAVAGSLGRPELAPTARHPQLRDVILASADVAPDSPIGTRTWVEGGYTIVRTLGPRSTVLVLDHGPVGYLSIAAHGHADTLAIWLSIGPQPVLVDAGTYLYHSRPEWRRRMRSTTAHNTLAIAGEPSSQPAGPFNWALKAKAWLASTTSDPIPCMVAEHDGYQSRFSVRHRRTIMIDDGNILLTDELLGSAVEVPVSISFLVAPDCSAEVKENGTVAIGSRSDRRTLVCLAGESPHLRPRIIRANERDGRGWVSPEFGVLTAADQVVFEGRLSKPSNITIHIIDALT